MIRVGVDPGITGAVVMINDKTGDMRVWDMPVRQKIKSGQKKNEIDGYALATIFTLCQDIARTEQLNMVTNVELVGARPGEGSVAGFSFGMGTGKIHGVLEGAGLRYSLVTPQVWKKAWGIAPGAGKKTTLEIARKAKPWSVDFKLEKHIGRSDAYCIALYDPLLKKVTPI